MGPRTVQPLLFVERTQVSRVIPALPESMLPVLEFVPVAVDDVGAGDENLFVVCQREFDPGERSADCPRLVRTER